MQGQEESQQEQLYKWQCKNFPAEDLLKLTKEELIHMVKILQVALGVCEEAGEVAHAVLKGTQKIREGENGFPKDLICDGIGDMHIYANQLLSMVNMDIQKCIQDTITHVLKRDWIENPTDGKIK